MIGSHLQVKCLEQLRSVFVRFVGSKSAQQLAGALTKDTGLLLEQRGTWQVMFEAAVEAI